MSNRFGDDTALRKGRISLNPVTHVDPIGTLLFPGIAFFTGAPLLGWARPTPVEPLNWRNKRVANFWVSIAGVLGNLAIAIVAGIIIRVLYETGLIASAVTSNSDIALGGIKLLSAFFTLNVGLFIFNLFPIPPLDGSRILASILPPSFESALESLEQYGFILLFIAVFTGVFSSIFRVVMPFAESLIFIGT
jgi:Zn-dependent protease